MLCLNIRNAYIQMHFIANNYLGINNIILNTEVIIASYIAGLTIIINCASTIRFKDTLIDQSKLSVALQCDFLTC